MFHVPIQQHFVNCRAGTTSLFVMFKTGGRGAQADSTSEDLPTNDTRSPIGHRISRATTHAAQFWRVPHRRRTPRVPFRLHNTHHRPVHSSIFISPKIQCFFHSLIRADTTSSFVLCTTTIGTEPHSMF